MASAASTELSAAAIAEKIRGLEATLAAQRAAWRETEAELKAWRKVHQRCVDAAAVAQAGLPAKRAKLEPPPTPPRSPSSSGDDDEDSSSDTDEATAGKAVAVPLPPAPAPPSPPPVVDAPAVLPVAKARARRGRQAAHAEEGFDPRGCPPGFHADGTAAPECEKGRKIRTRSVVKGTPHCSTCPDGRFWKWAALGPHEAQAKAAVAAWRAARVV